MNKRNSFFFSKKLSKHSWGKIQTKHLFAMVTLNTVCEHFMHLDNLYENILNYLPICKNNTTSLNHFVEKLTEIENETKDDETLKNHSGFSVQQHLLHFYFSPPTLLLKHYSSHYN